MSEPRSPAAPSPDGGEERRVVLASSLGTVFEWYDFYLYATLAPFFAALFFPPGNETAALLSAFATYAAGFLVRPFGALVFGRLGDLVGRKYTFLVTILIMGLSTFLVGILPGAASIGIAAPILLIALRMLQGLALGGEYGGAATYVAEHAPHGRRGYFTSWIQTTATLGLFLSLLIILGTRTYMGEEAFKAWGWRIPFLLSVVLLGISVWIRMSLNESPAFQRMKAEGSGSKAPLKEAFGKDAEGFHTADPPASQLIDAKKLKPGVAAMTQEMVKRYKAFEPDIPVNNIAPHVSMGFNNMWILLNDVLPRAIQKHGGWSADALAKAARETDIPEGGTMQGYGVKFLGEGSPMRGQNERSIAAVYQIVEGRFIHVYPPVIAAGAPTVLLPASSPWAAR